MPKRERERNQWANQLVDIIRASQLLARKNGASIEELEEELSIKKRSVHRLKKCLVEELKLPLIPVEPLQKRTDGEKRCNRWRIPETATIIIPTIDNIGLNNPELMALYVLRGFAGIYKGSSIMTEIDGAFAKIGAAISHESRKTLEKYSRLCVVAPKSAKNYASSNDVIEELSYAIIDQKTCKVSYHAYGEDVLKTYNINPLHFFEQDGGLYLIAVITKYGDLRTLAVERFKKVDETEEHFVYPTDFEPERYLSTAFTLYFGEQETFKIKFPTVEYSPIFTSDP